MTMVPEQMVLREIIGENLFLKIDNSAWC